MSTVLTITNPFTGEAHGVVAPTEQREIQYCEQQIAYLLDVEGLESAQEFANNTGVSYINPDGISVAAQPIPVLATTFDY